MRLDIQGLRCIAVLAVLLYHLWEDQFDSGYLGVDIFFVISGFLMSTLLVKRMPLNISAVFDFYFRRIKRIVPLYLFVILCSCITGIFMLAPVEFSNLSMDAIVSSTFVSNFVKIHSNGYFNLHDEFVMFKHTWSLAVEMQFYLLVPAVFYIFELLSRKNQKLKFVLIGLIFVASFTLQTTAPLNAGHMQMQNRLWQFMFGFIAYYVNSGEISCPSMFRIQFDDLNERKANLRRRTFTILNELINFTLFALILLFLCVDLTKLMPINRLIVTSLTMIMLAKSTSNVLLSLDFVVFLGDISYSIYLIHWPLFTIYRYWFAETYLGRHDRPNFIAGVQLIMSAICVAYFVEKFYKFIGQKLITNWIRLFILLVISYVLVFACIIYIFKNKPAYSYDHYMTANEQQQSRVDIERLYKSYKNNSIVYSKKEVSEINMEIHVFSARFYSCRNNTHQVPTSYNVNLNIMSWFCHDKGTGHKNIVVIGNSHSRELWFGLTYHFKNIYKTLTLFDRDYCMLFMNKYASPETLSYCMESERQMIPVLKHWNEPIDIIIVGNKYFDDFDPEIAHPLSNDEYFNAMQSFLNELENIAKDVVFFPQVHMDWNVEPYAQLLQKHLYFDEELQLFEHPLEQHKQLLPNVQRRIESLSCTKCIKVQWSDAWCNNHDEMCKSVSSNNFTFFRDTDHVSAFGSLFYGELLYNFYNSHMVNI